MKQLLNTLAACFLTCSSMAQITISSMPAVVPNMLDSSSMPLSMAGLPSMAPARGGSWDLDSITLAPTHATYNYKAPTRAFPTADALDSVYTSFSFSTAAGVGYEAWRTLDQSASGVIVSGEEILSRQAHSIGSFTGDALDSIVFPLQTMHYSGAVPVMKFPLALDSSWSAATTSNLGFNITVAAYRLYNATGVRKQTRRYLDSVVGWGSMRVPNPAGGSSAWIQVLQVQHSAIVLDSLFISGAPAPAALLRTLGLTQGQASTEVRTLFYRAGAFRPLAEATHSGPTFNSGLSAFYMHAKDLPQATASQTKRTARIGSLSPEVRIYPNPVRNGRLHIDLPANSTSGWSYTLINIGGQKVAQGSLSSDAGAHTSEINLPSGLQAGMYYLSLIQDGGQAAVLPLTVE